MPSVAPALTLGDYTLNRVGLGTNRLADTPENRSFLTGAVDAGVQMIDTAHLYAGGDSERAIGAALAPFPDELVVATKGGYHPGGGLDRLRAELEQSFTRLRTETIALYYLHRVDPDIPLERALGLFKEYLDAGRIEHVGLSEVRVEQIELARTVIPIAAIQNEYSHSQREHEDVVDFCTREQIVFVPFYPLHGGDAAALASVADRHRASPQQIKLAWLLRRSPMILPIPGTLSLSHLSENLATLEIELSDQDLAAL